MLLRFIVSEHDVRSGLFCVLPKAHGFTRRVLPVVIEVDDMCAVRVAPAREHRVVLAEIAGVIDHREWNTRRPRQLSTHLQRPIGSTVVDKNDLVATLDVQPFDVSHERGDRRRRVVHGNDKGECWRKIHRIHRKLRAASIRCSIGGWL